MFRNEYIYQLLLKREIRIRKETRSRNISDYQIQQEAQREIDRQYEERDFSKLAHLGNAFKIKTDIE